METLAYGNGSNVGLVREKNEDSYYSDSEQGLWLIADGMGGHKGGQVASSVACESLVESVREGKNLTDAIHLAHEAVLAAAERGEGAPNMGSTIVALRVQNTMEYEIAWVGDSRAYLWDGQLRQITRDHSYVQWLVDKGEITREQAQKHPKSNIITQALGLPGQPIRVERVTGLLEKEQKILLCSDGLNDEVSDEEITKIMLTDDSEQSLVDKLIDAALRRGGRDNISVLVISGAANTAYALGEDGELLETQKIIFPRFNQRRRKRLLFIGIGIVVFLILAVLSIGLVADMPVNQNRPLIEQKDQ
ncbi:MAG: protein phosphatase 2C domain-containing protein [Amphritea sp.]